MNEHLAPIFRDILNGFAAPMPKPEMLPRGAIQPCSLGVGCDETGVCYAEAHGRPEQCPHKPAKLGCPADRYQCAQFAKAQRSKFPQLHGGWTRSEWTRQVFIATRNRLAKLTKTRREQS
jgi:hypothetical protein